MSDRKAALDMALKQIEKQFGKGSVMKLGEKTDRQISTTSSGSLALDIALGVGGYPRGRVVEIYGPEELREDDSVLFMQLQQHRQRVEQQHLLTQNMHSILNMQKDSVLTSMNFYYHNLTRVNKR